MKRLLGIDSKYKKILVAFIGIALGLVLSLQVNAVAPVTNVTVNDGTVFIEDYGFFKAPEIIQVNLPSSLLQIGFSSFEGCTALKTIVLPENLTSIDNRAFAKCIGLTEINMPSKLINIGNAAFYGCESLKSISLPKGIIKVENNLFYGCVSLREVTIPEGVTAIGQQSFYGCTSLEKLELPTTLTTIDDGAFYDCKNLIELTIPNSVTSIGLDAFTGCENLKLNYSEGSYAEKYAKENSLSKEERAEEIFEEVQKGAIEPLVNIDEPDVPATGVNTPYEVAIGVVFICLLGLWYMRRMDKCAQK